MFAPARLVYALRPHASAGVVASAVAVAVMFAATPFVIPEASLRLGVSLGAAGLISTAKVGGFAVVNLVAPRLLRPSRRVIRAGAGVAIAANLVSALAGSFPLLMTLRLVAGMAAGLLTWVAWSDAMAEPRSMRDVAAAGPLAGLVASPVIGLITGVADDRAIYLLIAAAMAFPLVLPAAIAATGPPVREVSSSRSNRVLLAALFILTSAGSSLFVFLGALGTQELDLSSVLTSLAFSLNALAGMVAARISVKQGTAGRWLMLTAVAAISIVVFRTPVVFFAGLALWGFAFWMGIPETMRALRARSLTPAERSGDAQALMALGRTVGPIVGGALVGDGAFLTLGVGAGIGLALASLIIAVVEHFRREPART